jgi:DNA primase
MSQAVQQIKDRLGIVEVISSYLRLEKAGVNWKARCPFHQEKSASFFVSPARGSYHCFGCHRGGDVFSFVEEIEGLDFMGALKVLADRAGVSLDQMSFQRDPEKQSLYDVLELSKHFYREALKRQPVALAYLEKRGVKPETAEAFSLGLAPEAWQNLCHFLQQKGFSEAIMERAGLILKSNKPGAVGRYYDRFRSRLMFPLADSSGRVVGFSGRIFPPEAEKNEMAGGKYVNSPQTALYDKGRMLYGLDKAKVEIRRADAVVLVEGQFDLIMSHQAGVVNAVAVSGTALTREHLELLSRLTHNLVMAFDGDAAGIAAASRAIGMALDLGLEVKVAELPLGVDPADLILQDAEKWKQSVTGAKHVIDFLLNVLEKKNTDRRELAHAIKKEVYGYVSRLRERIDRAHFIAKIADITGLNESVIQAEIDELLAKSRSLGNPIPKREANSQAGPAKSRLELIEERLAKSEFLETAEITELTKEREIEILLQQRFAATKNLAEVERGQDEPAKQECLKLIRDLSLKINHLKNKN